MLHGAVWAPTMAEQQRANVNCSQKQVTHIVVPGKDPWLCADCHCYGTGSIYCSEQQMLPITEQ